MLDVRSGRDANETASLRASIFNLISDTEDGNLIVLNTLSGASIMLDEGQAALLRSRLQPGTLVDDLPRHIREPLHANGLLVKEDAVEEQRKLRFLQARKTANDSALHLIVLPTEKCNFRCEYCYETFTRGKMKPELRQALVRLVERRVGGLERLNMDWFGGEPLLAFDVMSDILPEVNRLCRESAVALSGHITTNGYLLTEDRASQLLDWNVDSFQITLDGPAEEHDRRRKLHLGDKAAERRSTDTFDTIMDNIDALLRQRRMFHLQIRTNYDLDSLPAMDGWISQLADRYSGDPRVRVDFCPIWADPCKVDVSIPMGDEKQGSYMALMTKAHRAGLRVNANEYLGFAGLVCYAAKANSLVVRSTGELAKCTVALESDFNAVGRLKSDGTLDLDLAKLARWTGSGVEEDSVCQGCSLSGSCQGNACPLERFENDRRPCPPPKAHKDAALRLTVPLSAT